MKANCYSLLISILVLGILATPGAATVIQDFNNFTGSVSPGFSGFTSGNIAGTSTCPLTGMAQRSYAITNNAQSCDSQWSPTTPQQGTNFMAVRYGFGNIGQAYLQTISAIPGKITTYSASLGCPTLSLVSCN